MRKATENETARECDRFGLCPTCLRQGVCVSVGRQHWFICETHKTCWWVGSNLFSDWRTQTPQDVAANIKLLEAYEVVEPYYHDPEDPPES